MCNLEFVLFANITSLATMTSSESFEIPFNPNNCALAPAFIEPPATKAISSQ